MSSVPTAVISWPPSIFQRLHNFSFSDALISRAAKQAGCTVFFSEDFEELGNSTVSVGGPIRMVPDRCCQSNLRIIRGTPAHQLQSASSESRENLYPGPSIRHPQASGLSFLTGVSYNYSLQVACNTLHVLQKLSFLSLIPKD